MCLSLSLLQVHGFDFIALKERLGLDFYQCVRAINYIRKRVSEGAGVEEITAQLTADSPLWADPTLLQPHLEDDALLFDFEDALEQAAAATKASPAVPSGAPLDAEVKHLRLQLEEANNRLSQMKSLMQRVMGAQTGVESKTGAESKQKAADADYFSGCELCWVIDLLTPCCRWPSANPRRNAQGYGANPRLPRRHCEQPQALSGQDCAGCRLWHRHSLNVCSPVWCKARGGDRSR